jgi:hypothetical protein
MYEYSSDRKCVFTTLELDVVVLSTPMHILNAYISKWYVDYVLNLCNSFFMEILLKYYIFEKFVII